jgi:hypothetical protein
MECRIQQSGDRRELILVFNELQSAYCVLLRARVLDLRVRSALVLVASPFGSSIQASPPGEASFLFGADALGGGQSWPTG